MVRKHQTRNLEILDAQLRIRGSMLRIAPG
jgi:hypothetical protein